MTRRFLSLAVLCGLILSVFALPQHRAHAAVQSAPTAAPAPTLIAEVGGPGKGRVWVGAVPANSAGKPVLVFVHGNHGKAQGWWSATEYSGVNDMYDKAYYGGYRTAFVSINDETGGPAGSIWNNGSTLNRQLDVILAYYGVSSVNIIAHSKGGVDTNSAVIHYGASPKIQKIITLSSPHHGSQLADLAYSWWAGWLAELLGQRDDGTYNMQTSYMSYFRSVTDNQPGYSNVRFYTAGGTDHGPWFSAMWFGGAYLPGDNDGVVTVSSSHHPRQYSRLFTTGLNHDNIRKGSDVWTRIEPTARTFFRSGLLAEEKGAATPEQKGAPTVLTGNTILRGGQINGERSGAIRLPIEGGVNAVNFSLLSDRADLAVTFVDPKGNRYPAAAATQADSDSAFRGAFVYAATVKAPMSGQWSVVLQGPVGAGYLLAATLDSPLNVSLNRGADLVAPGRAINLDVSASANGKAASSLSLNGLLSGTPVGREKAASLPTQLQVNAQGRDRASASLSAPGAIGLYQIGVTVTGVAADGTAFERSFATNVAVTDGSKAGPDGLPAGR